MRAAAISAAVRGSAKRFQAREGLPRRRADSLDRLAAQGCLNDPRTGGADEPAPPAWEQQGLPHARQDHGRAGRTGATTDDLHEQGRLRAPDQGS